MILLYVLTIESVYDNFTGGDGVDVLDAVAVVVTVLIGKGVFVDVSVKVSVGVGVREGSDVFVDNSAGEYLFESFGAAHPERYMPTIMTVNKKRFILFSIAFPIQVYYTAAEVMHRKTLQ